MTYDQYNNGGSHSLLTIDLNHYQGGGYSYFRTCESHISLEREYYHLPIDKMCNCKYDHSVSGYSVGCNCAIWGAASSIAPLSNHNAEERCRDLHRKYTKLNPMFLCDEERRMRGFKTQEQERLDKAIKAEMDAELKLADNEKVRAVVTNKAFQNAIRKIENSNISTKEKEDSVDILLIRLKRDELIDLIEVEPNEPVQLISASPHTFEVIRVPIERIESEYKIKVVEAVEANEEVWLDDYEQFDEEQIQTKEVQNLDEWDKFLKDL